MWKESFFVFLLTQAIVTDLFHPIPTHVYTAITVLLHYCCCCAAVGAPRRSPNRVNYHIWSHEHRILVIVLALGSWIHLVSFATETPGIHFPCPRLVTHDNTATRGNTTPTETQKRVVQYGSHGQRPEA